MRHGTLILLGGGGHCSAVIDLVHAEGLRRVVGILDQRGRVGEDVLGTPIIGTDRDIRRLAAEGHGFLISVGHLTDATLRVRLHDLVVEHGGTLLPVISPLARVAISATIGAGSTVGHFALVNSSSQVGANSIINSAALVEHDCRIGDHCHVATSAVINGGCTVGPRSFIGSGAVIVHGIRIGAGCVVGAGALVLHDVPDGTTVFGSPARSRS